MHVLVIIAVVFLAVCFAVIGICRFISRHKTELKKRMECYLNNPQRKPLMDDKEAKRQSFGVFGILQKIGGIFSGNGLISKQLESELARADIPLRGGEYLALWLIFVLVPGTLIIILTRNFIVGLCMYLVGVIIPPALVKRSYNNRLKIMNRQISDCVVIISNALRAGYSFQQAMELVSREMTGPIAREFSRTVREINLGTNLEEAMQNLGKRTGSDDLDLMVTAVLIQRQVGGNLAEILDNIGHTIRERIRIQGEIRTLTAQGRVSGLVIGLIPPILVVMLSILNPVYLKPLFTTPAGWAMLASGITAEVIGVLIIRKIINIEV